ncbi:hypothetical protein IF803_37015 [Bradyrhizobium sp. UFLA06-06]
MMFGPLEGWRRVTVTDRHTAVDYALVLKDLADIYFHRARTIVLVQDKSQHPQQCVSRRRLSGRRSWAAGRTLSNDTTRQSTAVGSIWRGPNSVFYTLSASIATSSTTNLTDEVAAREQERNANHAKVNWQLHDVQSARPGSGD